MFLCINHLYLIAVNRLPQVNLRPGGTCMTDCHVCRIVKHLCLKVDELFSVLRL